MLYLYVILNVTKLKFVLII